jgi:hypothetical protein
MGKGISTKIIMEMAVVVVEVFIEFDFLLLI